MHIVVRASGILKDLPPFAGRVEVIAVNLDGAARIRDIIAAAGVNNQLVMAVAMGGQRRDKDETVAVDGEILLIPPLAGG